MSTTVIADPTSIFQAVQDAYNKDPAGTNATIGKALASEATGQKMLDEAKEGLEAVGIMQSNFTIIYADLSDIDNQKFELSGSPIQQFAPTWLSFTQTFNQNLVQTQTLASKGKALIDTYTQGVIKGVLLNTSVTAAQKLEYVNEYLKMEASDEEAVTLTTTIITSYNNLAVALGKFQKTFTTTMANVGQNLEDIIATLKAKIEGLQSQITAWSSTMSELTDAAKWTGVASGAVTAFPPLAPLAFLGVLAVIGLEVKIGEIADEISSAKQTLIGDQADLKKAQENLTTYNKVDPEIKTITSDMDSIQAKLVVVTGVYTTVKNELVKAASHLANAATSEKDGMDLIRTSELQLAGQAFDALGVLIETFADGLPTDSSQTDLA